MLSKDREAMLQYVGVQRSKAGNEKGVIPDYMHTFVFPMLILFSCLYFLLPSIWTTSSGFSGEDGQTKMLASVGSDVLALQEGWSFHELQGNVSLGTHICSELCGASSGYLDTNSCIFLNGMRVGGIASTHYRWNESKQQS